MPQLPQFANKAGAIAGEGAVSNEAHKKYLLPAETYEYELVPGTGSTGILLIYVFVTGQEDELPSPTRVVKAIMFAVG